MSTTVYAARRILTMNPRQPAATHITVLVNDFGALGIDVSLVASSAGGTDRPRDRPGVAATVAAAC